MARPETFVSLPLPGMEMPTDAPVLRGLLCAAGGARGKGRPAAFLRGGGSPRAVSRGHAGPSERASSSRGCLSRICAQRSSLPETTAWIQGRTREISKADTSMRWRAALASGGEPLRAGNPGGTGEKVRLRKTELPSWRLPRLLTFSTLVWNSVAQTLTFPH